MSGAAAACGSPPATLPLRLDAGGALGCVHDALRNASFNEDTICRVLGIRSMADVGGVGRTQLDLNGTASPSLALYIRLFLLVEPVPHDEVAEAIDRATLDALLALDLLR